jgi:hypothetical protein
MFLAGHMSCSETGAHKQLEVKTEERKLKNEQHHSSVQTEIWISKPHHGFSD